MKRYLYVAVPGIRDYLGYGGHGILVFDIDKNHQVVKRIPTQGLHPDKTPSNVKGIAVSIPLNSIYVSTLESLQRIDLTTEKILWERQFEGGCDRMSISPDGKPCTFLLLKKFLECGDCNTGDIIKMTFQETTIQLRSDGDRVYMGDIASPWLTLQIQTMN